MKVTATFLKFLKFWTSFSPLFMDVNKKKNISVTWIMNTEYSSKELVAIYMSYKI